jgi:hypothetical protein
MRAILEDQYRYIFEGHRSINQKHVVQNRLNRTQRRQIQSIKFSR